MAYYLNSYRPIISTRYGRKASSTHQIPEYVDGTIRREPDFQNKFPSITALCRPDFVTQLFPGDKIIYMTNKLYPQGYSLVAILEVIKIENNHHNAALWYKSFNNNILPYNCIVRPNLPLSETFGLSKRFTKNIKTEIEWESAYKYRARLNQKFAICKSIKKSPELVTPNSISPIQLSTIIGSSNLQAGQKKGILLNSTQYTEFYNLF